MTKCRWCKRPFTRETLGRRRLYCKSSCRQRAFERRLRRHPTGLRSQPTRGYVSNDNVMTPPSLARALVRAVQPSGTILEPCAGTGNFVKALRPYGQVHSCEIDRGEDFLAWTQRVDWIVTNPPWSQFRDFLAHSLQIADRVAFVSTLNHLWTRARRQLVKDAGFGIEKIIEFDAPPTWQATGFQLGLVLLTRGYRGGCSVEPLAHNPKDRTRTARPAS